MIHSLTAQNISKEFTTMAISTSVLKEITVTFSQGVSYAITGVSGVGKSSFMHLIAGLDQPTQGKILFDDQDIAFHGQLSRSAFLQKSVGLMFQTPHLIRELSVLENVMLPGIVAGDDELLVRKRAEELLERVGLQEKVNLPPAALSMGQQQRVALCRALFNDPAFLLADEPTGALDENTAASIKDLLLELKNQLGMGLIISTHDQELANAMDIVYEIEDGNLVEKKKIVPPRSA